VTRLLDGIVERGSPIMANRVRACLGRLFSWSVGKGILEKSPVVGTERPAPERKRGRNLTAPEVKMLWEAIGDSRMEPRIKRAMRLLLVTLQRRGEIAGLHEREINRERREWVIPAERAKNGLAHLVPLTDVALELIGPAPDPDELAKEPLLGYVFHKRLKNGVRGPFHADALTHAMRDLFHPRHRHKGKIAPLGIDECRPHDLRRTGTTLVREEGIPREYMRFVLNHKDRSVTSEHYDLSDNLGEKRVALRAWEDRLLRILAGDFKRTFREVVEKENVAQLRVVA
jgi:integrase